LEGEGGTVEVAPGCSSFTINIITIVVTTTVGIGLLAVGIDCHCRHIVIGKALVG
jgi:hypothetical protein